MIVKVGSRSFNLTRRMNVAEVSAIKAKAEEVKDLKKAREDAKDQPEKIAEVERQFSAYYAEQDRLVIKILAGCLGKTEKEIEGEIGGKEAYLDNLEAVNVFEALYDESTMFKKNLEQPSQPQ